MIHESGTQLYGESKLTDDIEIVFKNSATLSAKIRNILMTGIGGNPIPLYVQFKEQFDFLFMMTSTHTSIKNNGISQKIISWRDTPGMSYKQIIKGLSLFEQYKDKLFEGKLLRFN